MLPGELALLFLLLPVCSFAPGFFFVRKLRWNPLEKLCGSLGLSLILLHLVSWALYCVSPRGSNLPVHPLPFFLISLACCGLALAARRDIALLLRPRSVRRALAGYGFLLLWAGVVLAAIRNYHGAAWTADWQEHFQRTLFFLRHFPAETPIFPNYVLPARPPMMNVLAAFFLAQTSDRYELFQVIFAFLNLLLFLPCYLLMPALGRRAKRRTALLVLLFAASPVLVQNATYTWTKELTAFYVVLAIWFYLAGWRKRDTVRTTAAFVALAAGLLVHYSAGPYVVILGLHYLLAVFPRRAGKWRELATIAVSCGCLTGTWLVWSMAVYGTHTTFASNTTVTSSQQYQGDPVEKMAGNLVDSILPVVARQPSLLSAYGEQRLAGRVRDWFFLTYQVNAIFGMGLVGGPVALWLAFRELARRRRKKRALAERAKRAPSKPPPNVRSAVAERTFWWVLIAAGTVLGIAVVGERDPFGTAHLTMLSLEAIGLTLVAAVMPWQRRTLVTLVLLGCAIDFGAGVWLQAYTESLDNQPGHIVFPGVVYEDGKIETALPGPDALGPSAWSNWFIKHQVAVYYRWRTGLVREHGADAGFQRVLQAYDEKLNKELSDEKTMWGGWFIRRGGEMEFLGDHLPPAMTPFALGLLAVMFVGLVGFVVRTGG